MARLVPAIHVLFNCRTRGGWVYFMTNRRDGSLYVGVTNNIARRAHEHREGLLPGFSKRYGLKILVYGEHFDGIRYAIQREKTIKHWPRARKVRLIHAQKKRRRKENRGAEQGEKFPHSSPLMRRSMLRSIGATNLPIQEFTA